MSDIIGSVYVKGKKIGDITGWTTSYKGFENVIELKPVEYETCCFTDGRFLYQGI